MKEAEHFLAAQCELGEGPLWDHRTGLLCWVDINSGMIHRCDPAGQNHEVFETGVKVGALALRRGGRFITATSQGLAFWSPADRQMQWIANPEEGKPGARFNDGKVDPGGRFWAGTMTFADASSSLYRLDPDLSLHVMATGITISNGLGWSPDQCTMYHADTRRQTIFAYGYETGSGDIRGRRVLYQFQGGEGFPDGLTVDSQGCVWCALWGGWRVVRIAPDGKIVDEVRVPTANPSCCAFGGSNLDRLFITTAYEGMPADERAGQPLAGDLFVVDAGVAGRPEAEFAG
jgi:sugar lactone lactonase YvrE